MGLRSGRLPEETVIGVNFLCGKRVQSPIINFFFNQETWYFGHYRVRSPFFLRQLLLSRVCICENLVVPRSEFLGRRVEKRVRHRAFPDFCFRQFEFSVMMLRKNSGRKRQERRRILRTSSAFANRFVF